LQAAAAHGFDVVMIDVRLGDKNGVETLGAFRTLMPEAVCVIMSAYVDAESAIDAIKRGAHDYLRKPFSEEEVLLLVERCYDRVRLAREKSVAEAAIKSRNEELALRNERLRALVDSARRLTADPRDAAIASRVLDAFIEVMHADSGAIYLRDNDLLRLEYQANSDNPPEIPLQSATESIYNSSLSTGELVAIHGGAAFPGPTRR
jgi:DNA-binding response OmpR family regulator